jgi:hypothetical protein
VGCTVKYPFQEELLFVGTYTDFVQLEGRCQAVAQLEWQSYPRCVHAEPKLVFKNVIKEMTK